MELTPESFAIACGCGQKHKTSIRRMLIAPGALNEVASMAARFAPKDKTTVVYDENTWQATQGRHPRLGPDIVLPAAGLHADERAVELLEGALGDVGLLVAVGSGTVHDTVRYVAARRAVPFISAPTAASVDGFVSSVAAMTLRGFKVTVAAKAPVMLAADTDVLRAAPLRLTRSGVGDLLGKYVCLADWNIGRVLTGEYFCSGIEGLVRTAVDEVAAAGDGLIEGTPEAYEKLMYALVLSGVAMQLAGNSRPASGAEHHISHLLELGVPWLDVNEHLHGEKVGVGAALCAGVYHQTAKLAPADIAAHFAQEAPLELAALEEDFGPRLVEEVLRENRESCTASITPGQFSRAWPDVQAILEGMPSQSRLEDMLRNVGAKRTPYNIGLDRALLPRVLRTAPLVRNRLTLLRLMRGFSA